MAGIERLAAGISLPKVKAFLLTHFLPLGLVLGTIVGITIPWPGAWLSSNTPLNTISIVGIFFISGLQLQTSEVKDALKAWVAYTFGFLSILVISPCLSLWIAQWDLGPPEFADGLALFVAMPTTVSSGVLMTTQAGGNTALAVLLSAGTNLIGVGTAPLFLSQFLGTGSAGKKSFDVGDLLVKLTLAILLPLLLGKALRYFDRLVVWVKAHKLTLKITSTCLLLLVPWLAMSTGAMLIRTAPVGMVFALIALGIVLHAILLAFNHGSCILLVRLGLPMSLAERKAVVIGASQKTVNTAVSVIAFLPLSVGDKGLLTLPCVLAHLMQILIDAFVVTQWARITEVGDAVPGVGQAIVSVGDGGEFDAAAAGRTGGLASLDGSARSNGDTLMGSESGSLAEAASSGRAALGPMSMIVTAGASASKSDGPHTRTAALSPPVTHNATTSGLAPEAVPSPVTGMTAGTSSEAIHAEVENWP